MAHVPGCEERYGTADFAPDQALTEWMRLFVAHVATKRAMLPVLKPMMSANPSMPDDMRGRTVDAASRLLAAGAAAGTIRSDFDGAELVRAMRGVCMSADEMRPASSERLVGLLFDGLHQGSR